MSRTKLKPLSTRKQEQLLALLKEASEAASLKTSSFKNIASSGPFPKREQDVDAFIKSRVELHHQSWIISPLRKASELITKNGD